MHASGHQKIGDRWHKCANAPVVNEKSEVSLGCFALPEVDLDEYIARGQGTKFCQFYRIVLEGLPNVRHIFKGLRRGLYNDQDSDGDKCKLVYTWKPDFDVEWVGGKQGRAVDRPAPKDAVFAVVVSPNVKHKEKYAEIDFFIGSWTWISEDSVLGGAPVEWVERYDSKLWSRSDK